MHMQRILSDAVRGPTASSSKMKYYFAPLEGLTDCVYRKVHCNYFPGVSRYYTPFLSPSAHRKLTSREQREIPPANTLGYDCVPQMLTKSSEDFIWMAHQCLELGYREVNLNLGCPSGTVTAKGKGSAMLADPDSLHRFLSAVFSEVDIPVSVKTRIGFHSNENWGKLVAVFNDFPICELIVHPRVRDAFYNGNVDMDAFSYAMANCKHPICYNGDLTTLSQIRDFSQKFPAVPAIMIGRGLIADPGIFTSGGTTRPQLEAFMNELLEEYLIDFGGSRNAMFRLKEHWHYLLMNFSDCDKLAKRLRKTTDLAEYRQITAEILHTAPLNTSVK